MRTTIEAGEAVVGAPAQGAGVVDLLGGRIGVFAELDLRRRHQAGQRHAHGAADDPSSESEVSNTRSAPNLSSAGPASRHGRRPSGPTSSPNTARRGLRASSPSRVRRMAGPHVDSLTLGMRFVRGRKKLPRGHNLIVIPARPRPWAFVRDDAVLGGANTPLEPGGLRRGLGIDKARHGRRVGLGSRLGLDPRRFGRRGGVGRRIVPHSASPICRASASWVPSGRGRGSRAFLARRWCRRSCRPGCPGSCGLPGAGMLEPQQGRRAGFANVGDRLVDQGCAASAGSGAVRRTEPSGRKRRGEVGGDVRSRVIPSAAPPAPRCPSRCPQYRTASAASASSPWSGPTRNRWWPPRRRRPGPRRWPCPRPGPSAPWRGSRSPWAQPAVGVNWAPTPPHIGRAEAPAGLGKLNTAPMSRPPE